MIESSQWEKEKISVTLWGNEFFEAYSTGETWNGWKCPYFTKEVADKLMTYLLKEGAMEKAYYDAEKDAYVLHVADADADEIEVWESEITKINDEIIKVYPIGVFSWCWSKD